MTRKLNLNLVPLGVAAVTAMMFAPLVANAGGIVDQFGGQATAVSPGQVSSPAVSAPVATTPAVSSEVLQRFEDVLAAARTASATTTETSSSDGSGSRGSTPAVSPFVSPSPTPVATFVSPSSHAYSSGAYVSTAPPGEHVPPYVHSAIATPDSVQVLGSGALVSRYVRPAPVSAVATAAPVAAYVPAPAWTPPSWDAPVAVAAPAWTPPNWDAPVAVAAPTGDGFGADGFGMVAAAPVLTLGGTFCTGNAKIGWWAGTGEQFVLDPYGCGGAPVAVAPPGLRQTPQLIPPPPPADQAVAAADVVSYGPADSGDASGSSASGDGGDGGDGGP